MGPTRHRRNCSPGPRRQRTPRRRLIPVVAASAASCSRSPASAHLANSHTHTLTRDGNRDVVDRTRGSHGRKRPDVGCYSKEPISVRGKAFADPWISSRTHLPCPALLHPSRTLGSPSLSAFPQRFVSAHHLQSSTLSPDQRPDPTPAWTSILPLLLCHLHPTPSRISRAQSASLPVVRGRIAPATATVTELQPGRIVDTAVDSQSRHPGLGKPSHPAQRNQEVQSECAASSFGQRSPCRTLHASGSYPERALTGMSSPRTSRGISAMMRPYGPAWVLATTRSGALHAMCATLH